MSNTEKRPLPAAAGQESAPKKRERRTRRHKKMLPRSLREVRTYALEIDKIARRLHAVADQMERAGVESLKLIPQGLESARDLLNDRVEVEFEQRLRKLMREQDRLDLAARDD
ncbi:hypothetical protein [Lignipirellula cremea]|uniref:Uncharacterized protein n=1 Tax=Lignipirellula cremea TaxID=2528010 RepID=A0A518E089_9BACT|nr:hypothetical protein [Lignipirellula cremea]QDU97510.1 hypothetical protein Pla8534_53580 [Lignipirellula cremea]